MDLNWSDADLAFRDDVRAFLRDNLTDEIRDAGLRMTSVYAQHDASMQWQTILHRKGWVAPAWPIEHGGCGWSVLQRYIFTRERIAAGAPPVSPMGVQMCGPALIGYGSDAQKAYSCHACSAASISGVRAIPSRKQARTWLHCRWRRWTTATT